MSIRLEIDNPNAFEEQIEHLPSSVDRYIGIVREEEIDHDPRQSREDYLKKKYA